MSIKILIDMNLSPDWVPLLQDAGWSAMHWSTAGDPKATDRSIMDWAEANGYLVFTLDLDFGTILALTHKTGPRVCCRCVVRTYCLITWETWSSPRLASMNRIWNRAR